MSHRIAVMYQGKVVEIVDSSMLTKFSESHVYPKSDVLGVVLARVEGQNADAGARRGFDRE
ncbi:hypothetical protein [Paenibacillus amylolyticus]|uniref:hypothetical protein n=1 Tax=Paenibacillus amylolyticus TaxID=1451 RepID=UPI003EB95CB1